MANRSNSKILIIKAKVRTKIDDKIFRIFCFYWGDKYV